MNIEEATSEVKRYEWAGIALWDVGNNNWNACLIPPTCEPDLDTVLWNYAPTAQQALTEIVAKAAKHTYN